MKVTECPSQISIDTLYALILSYDSQVPDKIKELEDLRLKTIPGVLAQRKKDGSAFLEKIEVNGLVEWKLCVRPAKASLHKS